MISESFSPDVLELVEQHMQSGKYGSQNELFRVALTTLSDSELNMEAIRRGIADMEAGRTRPLSVVAAEIAEKYGFALK